MFWGGFVEEVDVERGVILLPRYLVKRGASKLRFWAGWEWAV